MVSIVKMSRLKWLGHISMENTSAVKIIFEGKLSGKMSVGKLAEQWLWFGSCFKTTEWGKAKKAKLGTRFKERVVELMKKKKKKK